MRDRLIDDLIQGDRIAWGAVGALWIVATIVVLFHRPGAGGARAAAWTWLLLVIATGVSLAGIPLAAAIAVPRVRWSAVEAPELVAPSGETWRRLRGPAVAVPGPDLAVPTLDAEGRWVLFGLLAGKAVDGLPAAEAAPLQPGAARLCRAEADACRPWPVAWPDPSRPMPLGELAWSAASTGADPVQVAGAMAFDVETAHYLRRAEVAPGSTPGAPVLELVGRVAGDAPREGAALLFVLRRIAAGRLRAVRVIAVPAATSGHTFRLERVDVSLNAGRMAFTWVVRPALVVTSLSLPLGVLALLLAPLLRRRRGASRREAAEWIAPHLEAAAVLTVGVAVAAPAVVAIASLWGSR